MTTTPDESVLRELHAVVLAEFDRVAATVGPVDSHRETPCVEWDVQQLLEHQAAQTDALVWAIEGGGPELSRWQSRPLADPVAAVADGSRRLRAVLADDRVWDRAVWMPEISDAVSFSAARVVGFHYVDTLVHAWDLAVSIGADVSFDYDTLRLAEAISREVPGGSARTAAGAAFGPALPPVARATPLNRILTHLGRDPEWVPPAASVGSRPGAAGSTG